MIVVVSLLVVGIDQLTKFFFTQLLAPLQSIPIIPNIFHLTLVHNTGIAFGMFKSYTRLVMVVSIIGLVLIAYSLRRDILKLRQSASLAKIPRSEAIAIGFILGGAVANMIDRLRLGYVVDFFDFRIWPVFNIADSCITVGAALLLWKIVLPARRHK